MKLNWLSCRHGNLSIELREIVKEAMHSIWKANVQWQGQRIPNQQQR
jgi:hypothetical protein